MPMYMSAILFKSLAINVHNSASAIQEVEDRFYWSHRSHECVEEKVHRPRYGLCHQVGSNEGDREK